MEIAILMAAAILMAHSQHGGSHPYGLSHPHGTSHPHGSRYLMATPTPWKQPSSWQQPSLNGLSHIIAQATVMENPMENSHAHDSSPTGISYGSHVGPIWTALWAPLGRPTSDPKQSVRRAEMGPKWATHVGYPCGLPTFSPIHFVWKAGTGTIQY